MFLLIMNLIAFIVIITMWQIREERKRSMANENDYIRREQEGIKKNQEQTQADNLKKEQSRLQGDRQREEQRLADERAMADKQNQERLQKESEQRRKEQNERKERMKQLEEIKRSRSQADTEKDYLKNHSKDKGYEQHTVDVKHVEIEKNRQGQGAKKEQPYKPQEQKEQSKGLEKLRNFEKSVHSKVEEKLQEQSKAQEVTRTR